METFRGGEGTHSILNEWNLARGRERKQRKRDGKSTDWETLMSVGVEGRVQMLAETGAEGCDRRDFGCVPRPPLTGQ